MRAPYLLLILAACGPDTPDVSAGPPAPTQVYEEPIRGDDLDPFGPLMQRCQSRGCRLVARDYESPYCDCGPIGGPEIREPL